MKNIFKKIMLISLLLIPVIANAGNLSQTIHFVTEKGKAEVTPRLLYEAYLTASSHQQITGLPVKIQSSDHQMKPVASVGDLIDAFCFSEEMCGLKIKVLDLQKGATAHDPHTIVLSWWNFGWMEALDKNDLINSQTGSAASIVILTFKNTKSGAQIELTQVNVPDYKVKIQSPDGSAEVGPLSHIVNTHWHTLYWDQYRRYLATL